MNRNKIFLWAIVIIVLFINCTTSYITGKRQFMLISEGEEINIGSNYAPQIVFEFGGAYKDDRLHDYMNDVGNSLARVSHRPTLDYHFKVVNTSVINAFALPGGYVFITRGMLDVLRNEAELAGVLGHEIGHVCARHGASQMSKAMGFQIVLYAGLTIDQMFHKSRKADQIRDIVALGSTVIFNMVSLGYGRKNEFEADELGDRYIYSTGYDPDGMIGVMEVLKSLSEEEPGKLEMLFSSHPKTSDRMARVEKLSKTLKDSSGFENVEGKFYERRFSENLKDLKHAQLAYNHYDKAKMSFSEGDIVSAVIKLNEALKIREDQAPFYKLMGDIYYKEKQFEKACLEYKKSIQQDSSYVYAYHDLGNCEMAMNNYGNAEKYYKKAVELYPGYSSAHFGLGLVYYNINRWEEAAVSLENSMVFDDNIPSSHALLGLAYEKLGRYNEAETEFRKEIALGVQGKYLNIAKEKLEYYISQK